MSDLHIADVSVVDVAAGAVRPAQSVRVSDGVIAEVGADVPQPPPSATTIDGRGLSLCPGLIDTHVHFFLDGSSTPRQNFVAVDHAERRRVAVRNAGVAIAAGITTMRDLAAPAEAMFELRREIDAGGVTGPHVICCGYALMRPAGHCHWLGGIEVTSRAEVRAAVERQIGQGGDYVKLMASGGGLTPGTRPHEADLPLELMREAVEVAEAAGTYVTAHCHATESIERAIDAGLPMIEHATFAEPPGRYRYDPDVAQRIRDRGIVVVPTVYCALQNAAKFERQGTTYNPEDVGAVARLRGRLTNTGLFHRLGVAQIAGTDCGAIDTRFDALVDELLTYVQAGMSNAEALRSATSLAARDLRLDGVGQVAAGQRADLLLLDGDPLEDLRNLRAPRIVIKAGDVVHRREPAGQPDAVVGLQGASTHAATTEY